MQPLRTSVYHPQTNGVVECFNGTLKQMLRKFIHENGKDWQQWVLFLPFAIREVPHALTRFSPFELLYGRQPWGVLDLLREDWETPSQMEETHKSRTKLCGDRKGGRSH